MGNNYLNYKKKKLAEEKAAAAERAAKKKNAVTLTVWIVLAVLVVAAIVLAIVFAGGNDKEESKTTETTSIHSGLVPNAEKPDIKLPDVYSVITVRDEDMEPTIPFGHNIAVSTVKNASDLKVGDIISYCDEILNGNKLYKTLRIVDIIESDGAYFFEVKGDAKEEPESNVVGFDQVVGKFDRDLGKANLSDLLNNNE